MTASPMIDFRPGEGRALTRSEGIETRHAFSFGAYYDAANTGFGSLVACNEELLPPGAGFEPHHHRDLEIVTWVLEGELAHADDHGHEGRVRPGQLQLMHTGDGVVHTERNASDNPLRFLQMWLAAGESGPPSYRVEDAKEGELVRFAHAALHLLRPHGPTPLPYGDLVHVHVTAGEVALAEVGPLEPGDAVRLRDAGPLEVSGRGELLVWVMASPRG